MLCCLLLLLLLLCLMHLLLLGCCDSSLSIALQNAARRPCGQHIVASRCSSSCNCCSLVDPLLSQAVPQRPCVFVCDRQASLQALDFLFAWRGQQRERMGTPSDRMHVD